MVKKFLFSVVDHIVLLKQIYLKLKLKHFADNTEQYDDTCFYYESMNYSDSSQFSFDSALKASNKAVNNGSTLGIKYWKEGKYELRYVNTCAKSFRPLIVLDDDSLIYYKNKSLFINKNNKSKRLCAFTLENPMYTEMLHYGDNIFVIRTGNKIYKSCDLRNWFIIYEGKRGIKDSMILTEKKGCIVLIFIEYTQGFNNDRHRILQYSFDNDAITELKVFSKHSVDGYDVSKDYCRHIHVIQVDPYTNNLFVGTGDSDDESSLFMSKDKGETWLKLFGGSQMFRTLSFMFTPNYIYWNTDTHERQFVIGCHRDEIGLPDMLCYYPLINGALWCTLRTEVNGKNFYTMSSNSEGAHFDNYNRVYGIIFEEDEKPRFYELLKSRSYTQYSQKFPLLTVGQYSYFYDCNLEFVEKYELISK